MIELIKVYLPQIFIFLGVILTFLGGLLTYVRSNEYDINIKRKVEETNTVSMENKELALSNQELNNQNQLLISKNIELSNKNIDLSNKAVELSNLVNSNVTGGDSFCYITIMFDGPTSGTIITRNSGKFPLSSIQIRIADLNDTSIPSIESLAKNTFSINELPPNSVSVGGKIHIINEAIVLRLNIFCKARNGDFVQLLRLKRIGANWVFATKVTEMMSGKLLYKQIQEGFPVSDNMWE